MERGLLRRTNVKWNIWPIAYTQKGAPINEQERLKWIENLSEPRIVRSEVGEGHP